MKPNRTLVLDTRECKGLFYGGRWVYIFYDRKLVWNETVRCFAGEDGNGGFSWQICPVDQNGNLLDGRREYVDSRDIQATVPSLYDGLMQAIRYEKENLKLGK